ncbi:LuxR C-terminal-related transcriptional regulator [Vibrio maritimus]|uniref:LuxR C-terminal-related transcriptional regulator n=1 Tax=Vibrio maritimus TaxID=990268 RepID=UPI0040698401
MKIKQRVLIVELNEILAHGLKYAITSVGNDYEVLLYKCVTEAKKELLKKNVALIIVDPLINSGAGFEFAHSVKINFVDTHIILFSDVNVEKLSSCSTYRTSFSYLYKFSSFSETISIVHSSLLSCYYSKTQYIMGNEVASNCEKELTWREETVLAMLLDGMRNKDIAKCLNISEKTVATYKRRILDKFSADSIISLVRKCS